MFPSKKMGCLTLDTPLSCSQNLQIGLSVRMLCPKGISNLMTYLSFKSDLTYLEKNIHLENYLLLRKKISSLNISLYSDRYFKDISRYSYPVSKL